MNIEALVGKALGTCTMQKVIGRGEMSTVFLAQQSRPRRLVAVKVLQPMLPVALRQRAAILERIRHEIDVIASLQHPNIIQMHEYGEHHNMAYLVMPYITGGTLQNEIEREGPLPLEKVVFYLEQMAAALDYAHSRGIIHHGIKPANILIHREGRLLLTDFGQLKHVAKRNSAYSRFTRSRSTTGSLDYAAPEQLAGNDIDSRANLYSLGAILYQMVTGTVPFKGGTAARHQHSGQQLPHVLRPDLPIAAEQVMLRGLAAQPTARYLNGQEFAGAFREALLVTGVPLADLSSMFISAGLSDPHIPVPQKAPEATQQQPSQTEQQQLPAAEQQQHHQATNNQDSHVLIDTSPTLHLGPKKKLQQRKDAHISTDKYPTIYIIDKSMLKQAQDNDAPIDTSPSIHKVHKDMLKQVQDDSASSIDTSPAMRAENKSAHKDDIVARTRLTLPSLTSFLPPAPLTQSSEQETPPAIPALKQPFAPLPAQPVLDQASSLLETNATEPDAQLPTTETRVRALPTTTSSARRHAMPAEPEATEISREALIEQAATLPPLNRPVDQTKQPVAALAEQATTLPMQGHGAKTPARRTSLLFLAVVVLLVILILGAFAYMASVHTPSQKGGLPPAHHSTGHANTTIYSQPGSRSFNVAEHLQLAIEGHNSNVNVHAGNTNTVTVTTQTHDDNGAQATNNVTIQYAQSVDKQGYDHLNVATNPPSGDIDYTITVPASTQVHIEVASGAIAVDGINGVIISTEAGNLDVADIHGPVHAYTESGNITAHAIDGQVQMTSVNGSIRANHINGPLQAITQNGDVIVEDAMLNGQSTLETTNGSVYFTGIIDPQGTYKMLTKQGNIDLALPANAAFHLHASTHSGTIHNAFHHTIVGNAPQASITTHIGNGGSITINKGAA